MIAASSQVPLRVRLPPDVSDVQEVSVRGEDGNEWLIALPPDAVGGEEIDVSLPVAPPRKVDSPVTVVVTIPWGCEPGDEVVVEYEKHSFNVVVPTDCAAGQPLNVDIPADFLLEAESAAPLHADDGETTLGEPWREAAYDAPSATPPSLPPPPTPPAAMAPPTRFSTFCVGLAVEVLRSNSTWTRGTIDAADEPSATFTVRMEDGRVKYMVEEDELRHYRAGAFTTGDVVALRLGARGGGSDSAEPEGATTRAAIADYDDESDSYTVVLACGKKVYFVVEDDIVGGKLPGGWG